MKLLVPIAVVFVAALVLSCGGDSDSDSDPTPTSVPSQGTGAAGTGSSSTGASTTGASGPVTLEVTAQDIAFDQDTLTVPANTDVTINFQNNDAGVPHDIGITLADEPRTETCQGPCSESITFNSGAPGTYTFNCSVHSNMTGDFIVE